MENLDFSRVNDGLNCPCCGAPLTGPECPYCGRMLVDFACMETDKPFYLKVRGRTGTIRLFKVALSECTYEAGEKLYADESLSRYVTPVLCVKMRILSC